MNRPAIILVRYGRASPCRIAMSRDSCVGRYVKQNQHLLPPSGSSDCQRKKVCLPFVYRGSIDHTSRLGACAVLSVPKLLSSVAALPDVPSHWRPPADSTHRLPVLGAAHASDYLPPHALANNPQPLSTINFGDGRGPQLDLRLSHIQQLLQQPAGQPLHHQQPAAMNALLGAFIDDAVAGLIGVSGCGKTSLLLELSAVRYALFFEVAYNGLATADFAALRNDCMLLRKDDCSSIRVAEHFLECFVAARALYLLYWLRAEQQRPSPLDWLLMTMPGSRAGHDRIVASLYSLLKWKSYRVNDVLAALNDRLAELRQPRIVLACDECQLAAHAPPGKADIVSEFVEQVHGRGQVRRQWLFAMARCFSNLSADIVFSGTRLDLDSIGVLASGVAKAPAERGRSFQHVYQFKPLTAADSRSVLQRYIRLPDDWLLLSDEEFVLTGRARFTTQFLTLCLQAQQQQQQPQQPQQQQQQQQQQQSVHTQQLAQGHVLGDRTDEWAGWLSGLLRDFRELHVFGQLSHGLKQLGLAAVDGKTSLCHALAGQLAQPREPMTTPAKGQSRKSLSEVLDDLLLRALMGREEPISDNTAHVLNLIACGVCFLKRLEIVTGSVGQDDGKAAADVPERLERLQCLVTCSEPVTMSAILHARGGAKRAPQLVARMLADNRALFSRSDPHKGILFQTAIALQLLVACEQSLTVADMLRQWRCPLPAVTDCPFLDDCPRFERLARDSTGMEVATLIEDAAVELQAQAQARRAAAAAEAQPRAPFRVLLQLVNAARPESLGILSPSGCLLTFGSRFLGSNNAASDADNAATTDPFNMYLAENAEGKTDINKLYGRHRTAVDKAIAGFVAQFVSVFLVHSSPSVVFRGCRT